MSSTLSTSSEGSQEEEKACKGKSSYWRNFSHFLLKLDNENTINFLPFSPALHSRRKNSCSALFSISSSTQLRKMIPLNEKHKGLSIIFLTYSTLAPSALGLNLIPSISACQNTYGSLCSQEGGERVKIQTVPE